MNDVLAPIDKAGRVVLPKRVRDELAINPGDRLKVLIQGGEVILRPTTEASGFIKRGKALVFSTGENDLLAHEMVETIRAAEREGPLNSLARGLPSPRRK